MNHYRVTKYNPKYRANDGSYLRQEWSSYSDIGKPFGGETLTESEYKNTEAKYVQCALAFLDESGGASLKVVGLENSREHPIVHDLSSPLSGEVLGRAISEVLRELWWAKFESSKHYIHIGWDYYMYLGTPTECPESILMAETNGLFVEAFKSPYL